MNYPDFCDFVCTSDIFCVCETHIDNSDIVDINNYTFIAKNGSRYYKRKSGGTGAYVRNDIDKYVNVIENDSDYVLWISTDKAFFCIMMKTLF